MNRISASVVIIGLCVLAVAAEKDAYAPLPERVASAKTVFLDNETGTNKLGDAFYREVKKWNRWQVVADRRKADLILVLSKDNSVVGVVSSGSATQTSTASATTYGQTTTVSGTSNASGVNVSVPIKAQGWYLHVIDPTSGEKLWSVNATMGGKLWRTWNSIAKSLLSDVQKRLG